LHKQTELPTVDSQNTCFKVVDNVLVTFDGKTLIAYPSARFVGKVSFPSGISTIFGEAIYYNKVNGTLEDVFIPEGVETLASYSINYLDCKSLTLPSTLKKMTGISLYAGKFETLAVLANTPPAFSSYANDGPYYYCMNVQKIHVPTGSVDAYKKADGWTNRASLIEAIPSK